MVEGVGLDVINFIVGIIHHNHLVAGNECHHQTVINFGKGQTVNLARLVQRTVNLYISG